MTNVSFKVEVLADSSGTWASNGVRLPTVKQAQAYAADLERRWTAVREWRTATSRDPVNYDWIEGQLIGRDMREAQ